MSATWAEACEANPVCHGGGPHDHAVAYPTMREAKKADLILLLRWDRRLQKPKNLKQYRIGRVIHDRLCAERDACISKGVDR